MIISSDPQYTDGRVASKQSIGLNGSWLSGAASMLVQRSAQEVSSNTRKLKTSIVPAGEWWSLAGLPQLLPLLPQFGSCDQGITIHLHEWMQVFVAPKTPRTPETGAVQTEAGRVALEMEAGEPGMLTGQKQGEECCWFALDG